MLQANGGYQYLLKRSSVAIIEFLLIFVVLMIAQPTGISLMLVPVGIVVVIETLWLLYSKRVRMENWVFNSVYDFAIGLGIVAAIIVFIAL
jgi:hypothetical protein